MKNHLVFKFLATVLVFTYSCKNASEDTQLQEVPPVDSVIHYGSEKPAFPELSESLSSYIEQWGAFDDFQTDATGISGSNLEQLRARTERLLTHTDSLAKKFPDTLNTKLIASRLLVVRTRTNLLHQEVHRPRADSVKIVENIEELHAAVTNFMVQLNEKFQKDAIDEERKADEQKELEKQKRFLDSVYRAELQDKN